MTGSAVLVDVVRSGFVESRHRGTVVAVAADRAVTWSLGDPEAVIYPRSCNKPIQAVAMLRHGLDLDGPLLALAGASHSGEPFHLAGVRRILASVGLDESSLQNPPDLPLDDVARADALREDRRPVAIAMNCSGKHAAMLATCVVNGWPTDTYLLPDHPLQAAIRQVFGELTGAPVASVGVDGCGAPLFSATLVGLAGAFSRIVAGTEASAEARVRDAFVGSPEYASGSRRDEAALLRAVPGSIGKAGAEACYAVALPDGRAVALKIEDGSPRARPVAMAAALRRMGVDGLRDVDRAALDATGTVVVLGGGRPVGELRAAF